MQIIYQNKQYLIAINRRNDSKIVLDSRVLFKHHSKANEQDLNYLGPATVITVQDNNKLTDKLQLINYQSLYSMKK